MKYLYALLSGILMIASLLVIQPVHASNIPAVQELSEHRSTRPLTKRTQLAGPVRSQGQKNLKYTPQITITTPSYPVGIESRETKLVPYSLKEAVNVSGEITSRSFQFYTQYDTPLSETMGPYPTTISVRALHRTDWEELVYLPESVAKQALSMDEYAIVLKTTFTGISPSGEEFTSQASTLLLLPPGPFSKDTPSDQAVDQATSPSLHWNSSLGAVDYEYCFDTIDNNSCDNGWTGTYWLGTYETNTALMDLPAGTTFFWQVRANNTAGTTYANGGKWWSFTTSCSATQITVTSLQDSGSGSLRQAIAEVCPGGLINFAPSLAGETITLNSTLLLYKDVQIDGSALSSKITVSGNNSVTVFEVEPQVTAALKGLIVSNGRAIAQNNGSAYSGGINNFGILDIVSSTVSHSGSDLSEEGNGGGIYNSGNLQITDTVILDNFAHFGGGINNFGNLKISNSRISDNMGRDSGGIINLATLEIVNTSISNNSAEYEGGGLINQGKVNISNSTFSGNKAGFSGGGISSDGEATITNSTFFGNSSAMNGGGINNGAGGPLTIINSTFSYNVSDMNGGAIYNNIGTLNFSNNIFANSISGNDCYTEAAPGGAYVNNLIETNAASPHQCGVPLLIVDPKLGPLADNGGLTQTMSLLPGSPAINAGSNANCPATDQRGVERLTWSQCDIGAYEVQGIDVGIGNVPMGSYDLAPGSVLQESYVGVQNGPVKVSSPLGYKFFTSERVIYGDSFNEVMGFPTNQLTTEYWFPWYDNLGMSAWILVGNASSTQDAKVDIYIGGVKRYTNTIAPGGRVTPRFNVPASGPVRVVSTNGVKIFTSERSVYKDSFNEVMGYPATQLTTEYWFPWYDNKGMMAWILVGNPSTTQTAKVDIYIGGVRRGSYSIGAGKEITPRFNIPAGGPVRVVSTNGVKIFSSERSIYGDSFNEVMGYPGNQLTTEYWFPWYDNVNMSTWVLVGNPSTTTAAVDVYVGGVKVTSTTLGAGKQVNLRYSGLNTGPVRVVSTNGVNLFISERVLYVTSFNEVMGYPGNKLSTEYWFPWYDRTSMSTDILVGRP